MATKRTIALGIAVAIIFAAYLAFWLHVVGFVALAAGASALVLILVLSAAFGEDAEVADAAWREAVGPGRPELAGRTAGEPTAYEPSAWPQPDGRAGDRDDGAADAG